MRRGVTWVAIVFAMATTFAQQGPDAAVLLQRAQIKETIQNDLAGAIPLYEQAVQAAAANQSLEPTALLALARAYERAGRPEARNTYQRIVAEYGDSGAPATTAHARLASLQRDAGGPFKEVNLDSLLPIGNRVSPDGRKIVYLARPPIDGTTYTPRALHVKDLVTLQDRQLFSTHGDETGVQPNIVWSPNSEQVAVRVNFANGDCERRVITIASGQGKVMGGRLACAGGSGFFAQWSPDGTHIILGSRPGGGATWAYDLATVAAGQIRPLSVAPTSGFLWSSDGTRLTYVEDGQAPSLIITSLTGERVRAIPTGTRAGEPVVLRRWSSDNRIMFNVTGGPNWYAVPAAGGNVQKICEGGGGSTCADISPDGRWQITRDLARGGGRIMLRSTVDGQTHPLTADAVPEEGVFGGFSPDSQLVAFRSNLEGPWAIYVVATNRTPQAKPVKVVQLESESTRVTGSWTARGLLVQMSNTQTSLYRLDVSSPAGQLSDVPVRIRTETGLARTPAVSADAKRLVYFLSGTRQFPATSQVLVVADVNGGVERTLGPFTGDRSLLGWRSPTEVLVARSLGPRTSGVVLDIIDVNSGDVHPLSIPPFPRGPLQYSPGTDEVFGLLRNGSLQITSLKSGTNKLVELPQTNEGFTVSRSGRLLAYCSSDYGPDGKKNPVPGDMRVRDLITGEDRLLVTYADSDDGSQSIGGFSADEKWLTYATPKDEFRLINLASGQSSDLPRVKGLDIALEAWDPAWSPDGRFVVLSGSIPRETMRFFEISSDAVNRAAARK